MSEPLEEFVAEIKVATDHYERAHGKDVELIRQTYRRGYFAGHAAGKRRQVRETAPERHARGETRSLLEGLPG